jgi:predicted RNA polymerase sigma factor
LFGPATGPELVDALAAGPALKDYHLRPSVRADLVARSSARTASDEF